MLKLNAGVSWTVAVTPSRPALKWLSKTLAVPLPKKDRIFNRWAPESWPFFDTRLYRFPTGLLSFVCEQAATDGIQLELTWLSNASILPVRIRPEDVSWPTGLQPRDYQIKLVKEALASGRGILKSATASGKTAMMAMILKCLGTPKSLIVVGSVSLVRQTRDEVARWLGESVGEITSSRRVVKPDVVVALVNSLALRAHEDWAKEFLAERRVLMMDECLDPATLITVPRGFKPLGDLRVGDLVVTPSSGLARVKNVWSSEREAVKYTTASGRSLIASSQHKILGVRGGKLFPTVEAIGAVESLCSLKFKWTAASTIGTRDYLYGLYLGDGHIHGTVTSPHLRFMYSATNGPILKDLIFAAYPDHIMSINCRGDYSFRFDADFTREFVKEYSCTIGAKAGTAHILLSILRDSVRSVAVLQGLFDSDGWNNGAGSTGIDLTSKRLTDQIALVLTRLGMRVRRLIRCKANPRHADIYRVYLNGADRWNFINSVGFRVPSKQRWLRLGMKSYRGVVANDLIVSKDALGVRRLVDIELDNEERLFIANGFISHNCHHTARDSKRDKHGKIKGGQWYGLAMASGASNRYGLSATPLKLGDPVQNWRLVGATGPVFPSGISSTALIDSGYAARPYVYFLKHKARKLPARMPYQDVVREGITENIPRNEATVGAAVDLYDQGLKVLVVVRHIAHGKLLHEMLRAQQVPCAFINGKLNQFKQEELLEWLKEPGARIMVSTSVLGEGTNVPDLDALVYAKGGKAYVSLFQNIGRPIRPKGGPDDAGSCIVIILDDHHHKHLKKHVEFLRVYLATEEGYRVAVEGQTIKEFVSSILKSN